MLTEMCGKGGQVCQAAKNGELRCPLIVRPTSEDVITGHLFQALKIISPRWWLPDLLNGALGGKRFRSQVFRRFHIELWKNRPPYPRELLPWDEGSTQVDATITWENPPTTVFVEMKYLSPLATRTTNGHHEFPSDQVIRNIRVGLRECGWFREPGLFPIEPRNFLLLVIGPERGQPLVEKYRDAAELKAAIPYSHKVQSFPTKPIVGEAGYQEVIQVLRSKQRYMSRTERMLADGLIDYLLLKLVGAKQHAEGKHDYFENSEKGTDPNVS